MVFNNLKDDYASFLNTDSGPPEKSLQSMLLGYLSPSKDLRLSLFLGLFEELRSHLTEADVFHHSRYRHWTCVLHINLLGISGCLYT